MEVNTEVPTPQSATDKSAPTPVCPVKALVTTAHIISDVLSPLLVPTWGMVAAMTLTGLKYLPASTRILPTVAVFFITCVLPLIFIICLMKAGRVADSSISHPSERTLPFIASILCYLGAAIYLRSLHAPLWLTLFFVGAGLVAAISLLITSRWKISAHTGAIGGLCGAFCWLAANHMFEGCNALLMPVISILLTGLVGSSRLILGHHTPAQVGGGALLGFLTEFLLLTFLAQPAFNS